MEQILESWFTGWIKVFEYLKFIFIWYNF